MLAVGLILIVLAAGGGAYVAWLALQSSAGVTLAGGGASFVVLPIALFFAGALAMLLLWLGLRLAARGFRRKRAQRRELKALRSSQVTRESDRPAATERGTGIRDSGTARGPAGAATTVDRPATTPPGSGRETPG